MPTDNNGLRWITRILHTICLFANLCSANWEIVLANFSSAKLSRIFLDVALHKKTASRFKSKGNKRKRTSNDNGGQPPLPARLVKRSSDSPRPRKERDRPRLLITRWNSIMNGIFADSSPLPPPPPARSFVRRFGIPSQLRALARQIFSQGFSRRQRERAHPESPARHTRYTSDGAVIIKRRSEDGRASTESLWILSRAAAFIAVDGAN